jgi:hypothetical protein
MGDAVMTPWAKVEWNINKTFWTFEDKFHIFLQLPQGAWGGEHREIERRAETLCSMRYALCHRLF